MTALNPSPPSSPFEGYIAEARQSGRDTWGVLAPIAQLHA